LTACEAGIRILEPTLKFLSVGFCRLYTLILGIKTNMKRISFKTPIGVAAVLYTLVFPTAYAQNVSESLIQGWSGQATLGASSISGNTDANNINAGIRLGKTVGKWEHLVFGSYFKGESTQLVEKRDVNGQPVTISVNGEDVQVFTQVVNGNSDRLSIGYKPRYYWRPRTYFFGIIDYEKDKPANVKLVSRQLIGVGHKIFSNPSGFLSVEAGVGNKNLEQVFGDDVSGANAYVGASYLNRINDNVTFNSDFRADLGSDNTYTEINLGLAFKLSERMAVKVSHQTRGNTDIENPKLESPSKIDNATTINLVLDL